MWQAVEAAISHRNTTRYLTFFDQQNRERKRYTATVQVPGSPFIVAAIVNIDEFFSPSQKRIKQAGKEILSQAKQNISTQATAVERQFEVFGLFSLVGLCIVGVLSGLLLAARISRPLKDLAAYAQKLPFQDFSAPAEPESGVPRRYLTYKNEVGNLTESAVEEFVESLVGLKLTDGPIQVDMRFDEMRLDVGFTYQGRLLDFQPQLPSQADLLEDEDAVFRLSSFIIKNYVDRIKTEEKNGRCHVVFHFDH